MDVSRLDLEVDTSVPQRPEVRVLIGGEEVLRTDGEERNGPAGLLDNGALVPQDPPRRIALYGCGCGEFGCFVVAPLVERDGALVVWRDFRTVTGEYHDALPAPGSGPDPAQVDDVSSHALPVPDLVFDAEQYDAEVARASADRSWETREHAVCRMSSGRLGGWALLWPVREGVVAMSRDFHGATVELGLPGGDPADLVAALAGVLRTPDVEAMLAATRWTSETERRGHERRVEGASRVLTRLWADATIHRHV